MKLDNQDIKNTFEDSIIYNYLDKVITNRPMKDFVDKSAFRIMMFEDDGENTVHDFIDKSKVEYIILATKLSTMLQVFDALKEDDKVVMIDSLEDEINRIKSIIGPKIESINKEMINGK